MDITTLNRHEKEIKERKSDNIDELYLFETNDEEVNETETLILLEKYIQKSRSVIERKYK